MSTIDSERNRGSISELAQDTAARAISESYIDPRLLVQSVCASAGALHYPSPARVAAATQALADYHTAAVECLKEWNLTGLRRAGHELLMVCQQLAQPLPARTFSDELQSWYPRLQAHGWTAEELALVLEHFSKADDMIIDCDVNTLTLSSRVLTRSQLREWARPAWQDEAEWHETAEYNRLDQRAHPSRKLRVRS